MKSRLKCGLLLIVSFIYMQLAAAPKAGLVLESPVFQNGGDIPANYSKAGENISPPLQWSHVPRGTQSFALIMIDYDAKRSRGRPVVHWVVYNIPASVRTLAEGAKDITVGLNSYRKLGYIGMNPPLNETHEYYIYLYALDIPEIDAKPPLTASEVLLIIAGHVIGDTHLIGRYQRVPN